MAPRIFPLDFTPDPEAAGSATNIARWDGSGFMFFCPGCGNYHVVRTEGDGPFPKWTWNGSLDAPTFRASVLTSPDDPARRCHSFVTDGRIEYLSDCWHALRGQTVALTPED